MHGGSIAFPQTSTLQLPLYIKVTVVPIFSLARYDINSPVNVFAYNFKTGDYLLSVHGVGTKNYILPADKLQPSTLLRIYVIEQWSWKQTLSGDGIIEGSEIEIIPWSHVFIRIKK